MPPTQLLEDVARNAAEEPFRSLPRQMNKIVDHLQKGYSNFFPGDTWSPNVNLYETELAYLVCVDLAGVDKEKIDLEVVDQMLNLKGHRHDPMEFDPECTHEKGKCRVHLMEIDHGAFSRAVELPQDVDKQKIQATYRNGLLWVELPKK